MTDATDAVQDAAPGPVPEQDTATDPIEALAVEFGWKPKTDDFQGEHLDPVAFLKKQPERLKEAKAKTVKATLEAQRATKAASEALRRAKAKMRRELEREIDEATDAGDKEAVKEATKKLVEVESAPSGEIEDFKARNSWFESDDEATAFAVSLSNRLARDGASVKEQLEAAEKAVRKRFPELFEEVPEDKPAKKPPFVQAGQTNAPLASRKKGLADVPANIRSQWTPRICKSFGLTAAEFADAYWKEQA